MATLHDLEVDDFLAECVKIEPLALQEEFIRQPSDLAYWNELCSRAIRKHLAAKLDLEMLESKLYLQQTAAIETQGKRATQKIVESEIHAQEEWHTAKLRVIECEADVAKLKGCVEAVRVKKDMLIQMGADRREEMKGSPRIRDESGYAHNTDWGNNDD